MDRNTGDSVLRIFTNESLSARRVWIEIFLPVLVLPLVPWSLSARRVWIEISKDESTKTAGSVSLSARRVWIEIQGRPCDVLRI